MRTLHPRARNRLILIKPLNSLWSHSLVVPVYFAALSLAIGCWGTLSKRLTHKTSEPQSQPNAFVIPGKFKNIHANVAQQGASLAILGVLRFLCCVALTILCLVAAIRKSETRPSRGLLSTLPLLLSLSAPEQSAALHDFRIEAIQALFYVCRRESRYSIFQSF